MVASGHKPYPSQCPILRLSLRGCGLQGPIDPSLFQIPSLLQLSLDENNLSSIVIPDFLSDSSAMTSLTLRDCGLYGKLPKGTFLMPNLQKLDISNNPHLIIDFPEFSQNKALQSLFLGNTIFQKKLLDSINNLKFLKELSARNCNLSGSLSSSMANLIQLEHLDLSSNNFSGTIPSSYGDKLKHLIHFDLYANSLEGSIPSSLFSHPALRFLDLSYNQFSGYLPNSHNESSSVLEEIILNNNKLQGTIPRLVFELTKLQSLSLSNNNFNYPPSACTFKDSVLLYMKPLLEFFSQTGCPFYINAYPFLAYKSDPQHIDLNYAIFKKNAGIYDAKTKLHYDNMFDAQVDAAYAALDNAGFSKMEVIVSETGWASKGDDDEAGANVQNARTYNLNLLKRLRKKKGTPLRPKTPVKAYVFALFNENLKPGPTSERNFGLFKADGSIAYDIGFTGLKPSSASKSLLSLKDIRAGGWPMPYSMVLMTCAAVLLLVLVS